MGLTFNIESSALPANASVVAFRGSEGISRPYAFDIYVNVIGDELVLDDAPGSRVTLTIGDGPTPTSFHGVIAQIELLRAVRQADRGVASALGQVASALFSGDNSLYLVRLVPNLWQLSLTKHSRIFTSVTVEDVITQVLQDEGIDSFEFQLTKQYDVEEHITQYKESSLNFIHRWMEREGLYYYFDQSGDAEKLVITDDKSAAKPSRANPVVYQAGADGDDGTGVHFDMFRTRYSALPSVVRYTDYDYSKPQLDVSAQANVSPIGTGDMVTYGYRFFTPDKGAALAAIRADDYRAQAKTFHASGPVTDCASGYLFTLDLHPQAQLNTDYLAVSVDHFGRLSTAATAWGNLIPAFDYPDVYRVDVTAIFADQQYRNPELAPWPRIDGFENAVIDGPATSDYAQLDEYGRYAVKFKFDEGSLKDGQASTWVRKGEPHAGTVEGFHFPERKGTEVICAFLGGDPDRPIIIAAVTTLLTPSPVAAANFTKNVIQTGGLNRFEMEDLAGKQRVTMKTPTAGTHIIMGDPVGGHHLIQKTSGNSHQYSDGYHDSYHGGHHHETVHGRPETRGPSRCRPPLQRDVEPDRAGGRHEDVQQHGDEDRARRCDEDLSRDAPEGRHWFGDRQLPGHASSRKVAGDVSEILESNHDKTLSGNYTETIGGNKTETVNGNNTETVNGVETTTIHGAEIHTVTGAVIDTVAGAEISSVAGARIDSTLGVEVSTVLGARADITAGIKAEITAALHINLAPAKINCEPDKLQVGLAFTEMKAMKEQIHGLHQATVALHNMETGVYNHGHGLHVMEGGLAMYNHGLHMIE